MQKSVALLIPRLPFSRVVQELVQDLNPRSAPIRIRSVALAALQEASETLIVMWFQMLYIFSLDAADAY